MLALMSLFICETAEKTWNSSNMGGVLQPTIVGFNINKIQMFQTK